MRHLGFVFLCLTACGAVSGFNDAGGGSDGGHADASTVGTANVTTYDLFGSVPHTPLAGIDVVAVAPDGTQRDLQVSDASGHATVNIHTGDSITALYKEVGRTFVITFDAVKPNDSLVFGLSQGNGGGANLIGSLSASVLDIGATYYNVDTACTSGYIPAGGGSTTINFYDNCPATTPVLFVAFNSNGQIMDWARVDNYSTSGNTTLAAPTWQSPIGFTLSASGLPPEVTYANLNVQDPLGPNGYSVGVSFSGAPVNGALTSPPGQPFVRANESYVTNASFTRDNALYGQQIIYGTLPQNSVAFSLNNPSLLPWLGRETFDVASETASVTSDGTGTYEVSLFDVDWQRTFTDGGSENDEWIVIAPPNTTSVTLPPMTGNDAYAMPTASDVIQSYISSIIVHYPGVADYDHVRAMELGQIIPFGAPPAGTQFSISASPQGFRAAPAPAGSLLARPGSLVR